MVLEPGLTAEQLTRRALISIADRRGLSSASQEVLLGLAAGLSNRAIADARFVSLNTVKTEVRGILATFRLRRAIDIRHAFVAASLLAQRGADSRRLERFLGALLLELAECCKQRAIGPGSDIAMQKITPGGDDSLRRRSHDA